MLSEISLQSIAIEGDMMHSVTVEDEALSEISLQSIAIEGDMMHSVTVEDEAHDTEASRGWKDCATGQDYGRQRRCLIDCLSGVKHRLMILRESLKKW